DVDLLATNLQNVVQETKSLPSDLKMTATTIGNGALTANGKLNLIKEIPDMNLDLSIKNAEVTALNDLTLYYAGIDFESGKFELASELAIADGYMKGYFKPLLTDTKIVDKWSDPDTDALKIVWESFVGLFKFVLKNQGTDTLAMNIPMEGPLDDATVGVWSSVFSVFKNGWFSAFDSDVDGTIDFADAFNDAKEEKDNEGKSEKKIAREDRREQRRIDRIKRRAERKNTDDDPENNINVKQEIEEIKKG
ncbi:MAG: DUF748 domain-containing protein, partial [Nonlabens sp.]|nr:DUF748 domain-containing protein [Nonlabens sp.]